MALRQKWAMADDAKKLDELTTVILDLPLPLLLPHRYPQPLTPTPNPNP